MYSFVLQGVDTYYPFFAEVMLSATWNLELADAYGDVLAENAQVQRTVTKANSPVSYMFGPVQTRIDQLSVEEIMSIIRRIHF